MAGPYPGHPSREIAERQLRGLLDCGVRTFVSLMEEDSRLGGERYEEVADRMEPACRFHRFEVEDHTAPSRAQMDSILEVIDASLADERPVYVHCWGGRGRTGVVAGVWLMRRGIAAPDGLLEALARLREGLPGESPETEEQVRFVLDYSASHQHQRARTR